MPTPKPKPSPKSTGLRVSLGGGKILDPKTGKITSKPSPVPMKEISTSDYDKMLKDVVKEMKKR